MRNPTLSPEFMCQHMELGGKHGKRNRTKTESNTESRTLVSTQEIRKKTQSTDQNQYGLQQEHSRELPSQDMNIVGNIESNNALDKPGKSNENNNWIPKRNPETR